MWIDPDHVALSDTMLLPCDCVDPTDTPSDPLADLLHVTSV